MKKRVITTIILIFLLLIGLAVLLYPVVSDYMNSLSQSRVVADFNESLLQLSEADYTEMMGRAHDYNERLISNPNRFTMSETELIEYFEILNFTGRGVIGILEIDAINVRLPIYLGTSEGVLQSGIGLLEGSSFPIGGKGTHSVLSGHRGLPSSTLLTNADKLVIGDIFSVQILNENLSYEIDSIIIVDPRNMESLKIDPDQDYSTIVTCTPYGINSHRMLLRGHRVFPQDDGYFMSSSNRILRADARLAKSVAEYVIAAIPVLMILIIYILIKNIKLKFKSKPKGRK